MLKPTWIAIPNSMEKDEKDGVTENVEFCTSVTSDGSHVMLNK